MAALLAANMGNWFVFGKVLIFVVVTLLLSILRKVAENREKSTRSQTPARTPAPPPKKDNPFRNEIEAFLEEVGKRRTAGDRSGRPAGERGPGELAGSKPLPSVRSEPIRKAVVLRPMTASEREKPESNKTPAASPATLTRLGDDIAARKAPGSEDLGKQIRTHLASYLDASRMATQTQNDLGNAVERTVRQHLGETITVGAAEQKQSEESQSGASVIIPLLRNADSVRTAIVINEILGPPNGLRRRS
jgi:hypothetical protein